MKYLNGEGYIVTGFAMTEAEGRGKYILQKPIV